MRRHQPVCHGYRAFLSAAEWPSVNVPAAENALALTVQQQHDDALDIEDVIGKRILSTRLRHNVTAREKNALAALDVMSRFTANPKWLIFVCSPQPVLNIFSRVMIFAPCDIVFHSSQCMEKQGEYQSTASGYRFEFVENTGGLRNRLEMQRRKVKKVKSVDGL
jgi:hypothetical protein